MTLQSVEFLLFFFLVTFFYYALPARTRWVFLLAASYFFYSSWSPRFLVLLVTITAVTYICGISIQRSASRFKKRLLLVLGLSVPLLLLIFYKYGDFFLSQFTAITRSTDLVVPVGISFFTFKAASYLVEMYRASPLVCAYGKKAGTYALYVSFFPQLLAGPIDPPGNLLPQLEQKVEFRFRNVTEGLKLMLWGYFKKLVIADNLAIVVNRVYDNIQGYDNGIYYLLATVLFAFQVYCDFSGYSDIAIGALEVLGFKSAKNFDRPYHAKTMSEFWLRWHISLSSWLRNYLFLPISYAILRRTARDKILRVKIDTWAYLGGIAVTMFLGGLWHGANWTFVIWGLLMGFYLVFGFITRKTRKKIRKYLGIKRSRWWVKGFQVLITFTFVCFGWIFFRANSLPDAFYIITHLHVGVMDLLGKMLLHLDLSALGKIAKVLNLSPKTVIGMALAIGGLETVHWLQRRGSVRTLLKQKPLALRWALYYLLIFSIVYFGIHKTSPFIYSQF